MCNYADPMTGIYREQCGKLESQLLAVTAERNELEQKNNQYTRLLAIAVQRLGGQMVIVDDEQPCLTICGNVVSTKPVAREYPVVRGTQIGMSDE